MVWTSKHRWAARPSGQPHLPSPLWRVLVIPQICHIFLKGHCWREVRITWHNPQEKFLFRHLSLSSKLPTHSSCQNSLLSLPSLLYYPFPCTPASSAPAPLLMMGEPPCHTHPLGKGCPSWASECSSCQKAPPRPEWMAFSTLLHAHTGQASPETGFLERQGP